MLYPCSIHHYSMESQTDGRVMIENGKRFPGPVELIEYHRTHRDGLLTYPTTPCARAPNQSYVVFRGVSSADLEHILMEKARELGIRVGPSWNRWIKLSTLCVWIRLLYSFTAITIT